MGDAPSGNPRPAGIRENRLAAAVGRMFEEPEVFRKRRTRAVVVLYKDEIVAEGYADGFDAGQIFPGWSLGKSMVHALCGVAARDGKISINDPVPFFQSPNDPRSAITVDMLLRMTGGLAWEEYGDATRWRTIADYNRLDNPLDLRAGQQLIIPSGTSSATPERPPQIVPLDQVT